jgi:tetratricopeptide (TPR) repeat protein
MRSFQGRWVWILLAAVVVLLLIAVVSVAIYLYLQQPRAVANGWQDPVAAIVPEEITAGLALYPIYGASDLDTIDEAIAIGDLETAYATLVFSLDLSDAQRIGRLLLLGRRFAETEKPDRANLAYQQIYDVAVLSPRLSDPARADALLGAGKGWAALDMDAEALKAYDQVYTVAVASPYLQMANRQELLAMLADAYRELGDEGRAQASADKLAELAEEPYVRPLPVPAEVPELAVGHEPVSSAEVAALESARREAAGAIVQMLLEGEQPAPEQVSDLAQALLAEDAAKLALYSQALEGTSQPGKRINVDWHLIRWLTLKYQVAAGGLGMSAVPEWESQVADIQSDVSKAYEALFFDYEDLVTALPDASLMGPGSYHVRRQVTLAGQLGQYPNYPAQQMAEKLRDAVDSLVATGSADRLVVDVVIEDGEARFALTPAAGEGQLPPSP